MNVAYHLRKLGHEPALVTKVGVDEYGDQLKEVLSGSGLVLDYLQQDPTYHTGLVYADVNDKHEVAYNIVMPSAWDFIDLHEALVELVKQAKYFIYGSLSSRSSVSANTLHQLLEVANVKVLDVNLRPPHYNQPTLEGLLEKADILKMNLAELEFVSGWFGSYNTIEDQAAVLQEKFTIETLIVTLGGDGAFVTNNGATYRHSGYKVEVTDTIGSGDAFLAGFLSEMDKGATVENALAFACGIGAFIATQKGACPGYAVSQVYQLLQSYKN